MWFFAFGTLLIALAFTMAITVMLSDFARSRPAIRVALATLRGEFAATKPARVSRPAAAPVRQPAAA